VSTAGSLETVGALPAPTGEAASGTGTRRSVPVSAPSGTRTCPGACVERDVHLQAAGLGPATGTLLRRWRGAYLDHEPCLFIRRLDLVPHRTPVWDLQAKRPLSSTRWGRRVVRERGLLPAFQRNLDLLVLAAVVFSQEDELDAGAIRAGELRRDRDNRLPEHTLSVDSHEPVVDLDQAARLRGSAHGALSADSQATGTRGVVFTFVNSRGSIH
jgi:hypothetical protein